MTKLFRANFDLLVNQSTTITYNAISVTGERHRRNNDRNQDFYACNIRGGVTYAIVADGLGSATYSHIGAEKAVTLLEQMISEHFRDESAISESEMAIFHASFLEAWKKHFPNNHHEYDTTLLYVVILSNGAMAGSIGDGLILSAINKEVSIITDTRNSFSNQTVSLASEFAIQHFKSIFKPFNAQDDSSIVFLLMTDGISDDLKAEMMEQLPVYLLHELEEEGVITLQKKIGDWVLNWQTDSHSDDRTFCMLTVRKGGETE